MLDKLSDDEMKARYQRWLEAGGAQEIKEAMARAKAAGAQFALSTRPRFETLLEPMDF